MELGQTLTTGQVLEMFSEEVSVHGGSVKDTYDDGTYLFVRSVLPGVKEVRPRDGMRGGVAMKFCGGEAWVHPYLFRLVCQNGMLMARTLGAQHLAGLLAGPSEEAIRDLRVAVGACSEKEVFLESIQRVRTIQDYRMDQALNLMAMRSRLSSSGGRAVMRQILQRFFEEQDRSLYGLMNAVTSVARDTNDPEMKWNLEELGGSLVEARDNVRPRRPAGAARRKLVSDCR